MYDFHIIIVFGTNSDPTMSKNVLTKPPSSHVLYMQTPSLSTFHTLTCSSAVPDCPMQGVHGEENYIDLIHLTGPVRYLVIGWLSWSLIL